MILNCEYKNAAKFEIDTVNNKITWDNRIGNLEKLIADYGEHQEIILAGVDTYYRNGNSYCTPNILIDDITACNNWEQLEKLFTP